MVTPMKTVQEIFNRLQEKRREQKSIRTSYKGELAASHEYQRITEDLERLRARKKQYEQSVRSREDGNFKKIDELTFAIRQDAQLLSDIALTSMLKGESVSVQEEDVEYEPVFTVRYRKIR